jgi:hypothetical protein
MNVARVFPRKTKASPTDALAFFDVPGLFDRDIDEVHVSVTSTWDIERARRLADAWSKVAPVRLGGPVMGEPGGDFVSGWFLERRYVIISRDCPNRCWFYGVPKREGPLRELPIHEGCNVLDDNLLACSEPHIRAVFAMLAAQCLGSVQFTGGLEAARLRDWHVDLLRSVRPSRYFLPTTLRVTGCRLSTPRAGCSTPDSPFPPKASAPMRSSATPATPWRRPSHGSVPPSAWASSPWPCCGRTTMATPIRNGGSSSACGYAPLASKSPPHPRGTAKGIYMKASTMSFRVYVTPEEKQRILAAAHDCRMSMSAYCRTIALGGAPVSKADLEQVDRLLKMVADLNRLGNLMKILLTNEERLQDMGRDMATTTIDGILVDIRFSTGRLREMVDAIHGIPIDDVDGDESEESETAEQ